jgi:hypothetical protein
MLGDLRANRAAYDPNRVLRQPNFSPKGAPARPERTVTLAQVVDGFSYNTQLLFLPNRYFPNALAQLDILRRAANYRPRWFCVPDDIDQPIQPYDTLYYQIEVSADTYVWGYSFASVSATAPGGAPTATTASDLLIQAVDACTGIPLFQDFANGGGSHSNFSSRALPIVLTQARLILNPGLINVEISNRTPNTITCQLLLHAAEPCRIITEEERAQEWKLGLAGLRGLR